MKRRLPSVKIEMDAEESTKPFSQMSSNPFEDDIDDDTFLRPSTSRFKVTPNSQNPFFEDIAQGDIDLVGRREQVEARTLASTERSLAVLMESELVGEGIAKELSEQKEQLENCHKNVDDINANLRTSQKHLKRIKSFFGGFKDFLMGVRIKPVKTSHPIDKCRISEESLGEHEASVAHRSRSTTIKQTASSHPGLLLRSSDGDNAKPQNLQTAIDKNLDQMFNQVVNLKGLATDLGDELDYQHEFIDSLNDKMEQAQMSISKQNKDIAKLLK